MDDVTRSASPIVTRFAQAKALPHWYLWYCAWALFTIAVLGSSLALNYRQARLQSLAAQRFAQSAEVLERGNSVVRAMVDANHHGKDVFATRDVAGERARLALAGQRFATEFGALREAMTATQSPEIRAQVGPNADTVAVEMTQMLDVGLEVLRHFELGDIDAASRELTIMDEHFAKATSSLLVAARIVREQQRALLTGQRAQAIASYRFGLALIVIGILAAALAVWHGWYMHAAVRRYARERERDMAELAGAHERAERAARAKGQFLANISHEIRTPMNGVLGMLEALSATPLEPEQKKLLRTANASADLLLSIIDDVLDFSKIDAGVLVIESAPMDLAELVRHVQSVYAPVAAEKLLTLRSEIPKRSLAVCSDLTRLTQLLSNLVSNAIKFTKAGEVVVKVRVLQEDAQTTTVRIAVADTGIGLDEDIKHRLFSPFVQADDSTSRRYGGTGLGLAICRQLVRLLDSTSGKIGVESAIGQGSEFYCELCLRKADEAPILRPDTEDESRPEKSAPTRFVGRVLIAEDNETNQQVVATMLRNLGVQIVIAGNGREAVAAVRGERFDLVLMDYHMPEMDGCDATRAIRKFEQSLGAPRLPIVAVTASVLKEDRERCLASGMDDFAAKPIRQRTLVRILERWLKVAPVQSAGEMTLGHDSSSTWAHLPRDHFDVEQLLEMRTIAGESFNALLEQFHASAREGLSVLKAALAGGNGDELRRAAHKFKGAAASLGAKALAEQCHLLESVGKEHRMEAAPAHLAALEQEYLEVRSYMDACAADVSKSPA